MGLPKSIADQVDIIATRHGLDPLLVAAVVDVESAGNPDAWNPEPRFRYFWDVRKNEPFRRLTADEIASETPPDDFGTLAGDRDQEWWAQQASWGLMQVMGSTARSLGLQAEYLTVLNKPAVGLEYGCRYLARQLERYNQSEEHAVSAYNAGTARTDGGQFVNQSYVDKVWRRYSRLRGEVV